MVVAGGSAEEVVVLGWSSDRGVERVSFGIGGVVLPIVSVTTGALELAIPCVSVRGCVVRRTGAGLDPVGYVAVAGKDPAIVAAAVVVPSGFGFGSVKFVVVSTFVSVIGGVSPGPLIVEVTPLAEPSWTVW
ncbi:MAG: hypothetical protein QOC81_3756 [Thermoanaerobaculia bacterium]|nr:hypothetical protein [Thermoanaerobaculia bacterium]